MNPYLFLVLIILLGSYLLEFVVSFLNLGHVSLQVPDEFREIYDPGRYEKSQRYLQTTTRFGWMETSFFTGITLLFILVGGFGGLDDWLRGFGWNSITTGLSYAGILMLATSLLRLPFSAYRVFGIEEKFGFNQTKLSTFLLDRLKGLILGGLLGAILLGSVFWIFESLGFWAWLYCWLAVILFQLFVGFLAPVLIMPLFNKFVALEQGELKTQIENYAQDQKVKLKGIFTMDGSKRSKKANAFFTGFGKFRRIVLFDTLIEKHPVDELVTVLAHEIGHLKKKHIWLRMFLGILMTGMMLYLASFMIDNRGLFDAFAVKEISVYAGLIFFGFLYSPISTILGIWTQSISRRNEFEADEFAISTTKKPDAFVSALKRLSVDNLANLTPHPWYVFLHYSHPPILKRIENIRTLGKTILANQPVTQV